MAGFTGYLNSRPHRAGVNWVRDLYGVQQPQHGAAGMAARATGWGKYLRFVGPAFLAYSAYSGFREGGLWGATKNVARETATTYAIGAGLSALGITLGGIAATTFAGVGIAAGIGYGAGLRPRHLSRPWVDEYSKKQDRLEIATPIMDEYGTVATMRQRSIRAIQNSRLNGRTALGNEGMLMYQRFNR